MSSKDALSTLDALEKLVSFNTVSDRSNLPLISFAEEYLKLFGFHVQRFPNKDGTKATLLAAIGPQDKPGIVLSGHSDVVPVEGQEWETDPFQLTIRDDRAYGRGTCDMKGFLAVCLGMAPLFCSSALKQPVYLMFSYDEEVTCLGSVDAIDWLVRNRPLPDYALIGEPTMMEIIDAHKNNVVFTSYVRGLEAHSSMPHLGASAVMAAGELIAGIGRVARELEEKGDASGRFDPSYSTLHVASVYGGGATNVLARDCTLNWELRALPDQSIDEVEDKVAMVADKIVAERLTRFGPYGSITTERGLVIPGLDPTKDKKAGEFIGKLLNDSNRTTGSYCTEGGHFQAAGISTIICGPGSIDQAHKANEFILLDQLVQSEALLCKMVEAIS